MPELIFVSYMPGGCGKFISALIWSLYEKKQVLLSDMGSAHPNFWAFYGINTYIEDFWDDLLENGGMESQHMIDVIDRYEMSGSRAHGLKIGQLHTVRFAEILKRFPRSRIVYIRQKDRNEIIEAAENFFLKYFLEYQQTMGNNSDTLSRDNWHKYLERNRDLFPDTNIEHQ